MDTTTINGLHSCKPGNDPIVGQIKLFVIEHRQGKSGKPYIKIKSANEENGGTPHRILGAEKTDFVDKYGNHSYNLEVEASSSPPSQVQQLRKIVKGETLEQQGAYFHEPDSDWPEAPPITPEPPPAHPLNDSGVSDTRKHLMQSANLLVLCIRAAEKAVAPHQPVVAQTPEQFQSDVAKLFIEASGRRTTDGVHWWSYVDKMPTKPIE